MAFKNYPYVIHTNRELELMLQGTKPLAAFSEVLELSYDEWIIPEKAFAPHVARGAIVKREHIFAGPLDRKSRSVLYALPNEEWRIDAYLLMWEVAQKSGWNESMERMEGRLLGYEEWQCDFHIQNRFSKILRTDKVAPLPSQD
jgi:hypothetical protein